MVKILRTICLSLLGLLALHVSASHIDDTDGDLNNFSFDKVVFRLQKDCSIDRIPDVSKSLPLKPAIDKKVP